MNNKLQTLGEVECTKRFLAKYNEINGTSYSGEDIEKNANESSVNHHIDVYIKNKNGLPKLKIQVTSPDSDLARWLGVKDGSLYERNNHQFFIRLLYAIEYKNSKYTGKEKNELILLLCNYTSFPPPQMFTRFKNEYNDYFESIGFKEIWFVGVNDDVIKLF